MSAILLIYALLSTTPPATQISLDGPPNIRYGLRCRPLSPYDYSTVYSQPFDSDLLQNGYSNYGAGDRWVCDDFILEFDADIREIVVYQIYTGQQASTYSISISVDDTGDSDPNTNTVLWAKSVACTNEWIYGP